MSRSYFLVDISTQDCSAFQMSQILAILGAQARPPDTPKIVEWSLDQRLNAAFVLRGSPVQILPRTRVIYSLLPSLGLFRVMSPRISRNWGEPRDLQELAVRISWYYPAGVMVLHHDLKAAFSFRCDAGPTMYRLSDALRQVRQGLSCLVLARIQQIDGKIVWAAVQVTAQHVDLAEKAEIPWLRCFITLHALQVGIPRGRSMSPSSSRSERIG